MDAMTSVKLLREYNACPKCGNDKLGNGKGFVSIEGDIFKRGCNCGWEVEINPYESKEE